MLPPLEVMLIKNKLFTWIHLFCIAEFASYQPLTFESISVESFTFGMDQFVVFAQPFTGTCSFLEWDHVETVFRAYDSIQSKQCLFYITRCQNDMPCVNTVSYYILWILKLIVHMYLVFLTNIDFMFLCSNTLFLVLVLQVHPLWYANPWWLIISCSSL